MTQAKAKHLKDSMCNEFAQVFQLCQFVLVRLCSHVFQLLCSLTVKQATRLGFDLTISASVLMIFFYHFPEQLAKCSAGQCNTEHIIVVPQLDSSWIHLRDGSHHDARLQGNRVFPENWLIDEVSVSSCGICRGPKTPRFPVIQALPISVIHKLGDASAPVVVGMKVPKASPASQVRHVWVKRLIS